MSKGSPIIPIRIPEELLRQIEAQIDCRNAFSPRIPWNRSDFILTAIREKLKKMERSRTWRKWSGKKLFKPRGNGSNQEG